MNGERRGATWPVGVVPATDDLVIPFQLTPNTRSLLVVNPLSTPIYIAYRRAPQPTEANNDIACPAHGLLVAPIVAGASGAIALLDCQAVARYPGAVPAADAGLVANLYASEIAFSPNMAAGPGAGPATDASLVNILTELQAGPSGYDGTTRSSAVVVGVAAGLLPAAPLANRRAMAIQNKGSVSIYIGGAGVTVAAGFEIEAGAAYDWPFGATAVYAISGSAGQDVRVLETA
jgi:hypothetical protein